MMISRTFTVIQCYISDNYHVMMMMMIHMLMMMMMMSYQHIIDKTVVVLAEFFIRLVAINVAIVFMYFYNI